MSFCFHSNFNEITKDFCTWHAICDAMSGAKIYMNMITSETIFLLSLTYKWKLVNWAPGLSYSAMRYMIIDPSAIWDSYITAIHKTGKWCVFIGEFYEYHYIRFCVVKGERVYSAALVSSRSNLVTWNSPKTSNQIYPMFGADSRFWLANYH